VESVATGGVARGGRRLLVPLPDPDLAHTLLYARIEDTQGPVRLAQHLELGDLQASLHLHNAREFLDSLQAQGPAGVKATVTGNLSRAFVLETLGRLRLDEREHDWLSYTRVRSEDDAWPVHLLRVLLQLAGLIRKYRGRFLITSRGTKLLTETRAGELQAHLFRTFFGKLNLGYLDGMAEDPALQRAVPYILWILRLLPADWLDAPLLHQITLAGVRLPDPEAASEWDDPVERFESRVLRPLVWFGLLERRPIEEPPETTSPADGSVDSGLPGDSGGSVTAAQEPVKAQEPVTAWRPRRYEYRKTGLFDRFVG
jgi:hypothetical protein